MEVTYQSGEEDVGEDGQKDNNTCCDEVHTCCVLELQTTWEEGQTRTSSTDSRQRDSLQLHCSHEKRVICSSAVGLAMVQIMAKAANVPASPCPLMMGVVYEEGSKPAIPNRLPCSTAPKAAAHRQVHHTDQYTDRLCNKQSDSQLMMMIFTMVTEKNGSGCRGTLTRTAVTTKTTMMTSRLPITRSF